MISGGNRYPAKAELGAGRGRRRGRDLMVGVSLMRVLGARCNSARRANLINRSKFTRVWEVRGRGCLKTKPGQMLGGASKAGQAFKIGGGTKVPRRVRFPSASATRFGV